MVSGKLKYKQRRSRGFSLLEMLVAIAILMVVFAVVFNAMSWYSNRYRGQQSVVATSKDLRGTVLLMEQEVGESGLDTQIVRSLTTAVTKASTPQTMPLSNNADIYVGQKFRVDIGNSEEYLSISSITAGLPKAVINKNHAAGVPVTTVGPFPSGVLNSSTSSVLKVYGDINRNNQLAYVEYAYDPVGQTLCRSITPVSASAKSACSVVIPNVTAAAFNYDWQTAGGFTICKQVTITISAQTSRRDPQTNAFVVQTVQREIAPRNLLLAYQFASSSSTNLLQMQPTSVPLP